MRAPPASLRSMLVLLVLLKPGSAAKPPPTKGSLSNVYGNSIRVRPAVREASDAHDRREGLCVEQWRKDH